MSKFETLFAYLGRLLEPVVFFEFALLAFASWLLRRPISKWLKLSELQSFWLGCSFAGILALTLRIWDLNGTGDVFWLLDASLWSGALAIGVNWTLNALMFVPAAFLLVWFGKPWPAAMAALVAFSAFIETLQMLTRWGVGDPADFVSNSVGAALGVLAALLLRRARLNLSGR